MFASLNSMFLSPLEGTLWQFNSPCDGERLFGLQMSLLIVCFICRNGHAGFWDKKKGLVWRLLFIFILASAPWTWKAKRGFLLSLSNVPITTGSPDSSVVV